MIYHMDEGIGQVLAALDARGLTDDTLVVFTSDNGGERFSNNWPFVGQKMDSAGRRNSCAVNCTLAAQDRSGRRECGAESDDGLDHHNARCRWR